jgi:hypothetical protein
MADVNLLANIMSHACDYSTSAILTHEEDTPVRLIAVFIVASAVLVTCKRQHIKQEVKKSKLKTTCARNYHYMHKRNLANNTGKAGGGGAKLTKGLRYFILQSSQI